MPSYFKVKPDKYEPARQRYLEKLYGTIGSISCVECGFTVKIKLWNRTYSCEGMTIHHIQTRRAHSERAGDPLNFRPLCNRDHDKINVMGENYKNGRRI